MNDIPFSYTEGSHWFVARTHIRMEEKAERDLKDIGFEVFLPMEKRWVKHARRKEQKSYPLFTSYIFIRIDPSKQGFYAVKNTHGIERLLGSCGVPLSIPERLIEMLKDLEEIGCYDETSIVPNLPAGSKVKIVEGPFTEFIGTLKAASKRKSVEVLLDLFGRETVNKMPLSWVRAA